ncbi:hypothetical protein RSOLAG1IB_08626 [Rhizoctonia solani AG-1 IB]|uniref:Uncharacterized protein n=1 Tax=Thanatephorus cucumeris (strain AG1-IB / isolate 7/3/14) TaxID=1108050 RepID=A0A0B7FKR7_THACB|nr:hypothetical protein RSOLAG1IB_08626 [Rhizoctonia solani AG-1 IB]
MQFSSLSLLWIIPAALVCASPVQPGIDSLSTRAQCSPTGPYRVCIDYCCKGVGCNGFLNCDRSTCNSSGTCRCKCQYN